MVRNTRVALAALAVLLLGVGSASADGAFAVGSTGNLGTDGVAMGYTVNAGTRQVAMDNALARCRFPSLNLASNRFGCCVSVPDFIGICRNTSIPFPSPSRSFLSDVAFPMISVA